MNINGKTKDDLVSIIMFLYGAYTNDGVSSYNIDKWIANFCSELGMAENDLFKLSLKIENYSLHPQKIQEDISRMKSNYSEWNYCQNKLIEMLRFGMNSNNQDMKMFSTLLFMSC